jgi:hypothetical protein
VRVCPVSDVGAFYPPKLIDDPAFADDATGDLTALFEPESGFVDDPMLAARNLAHAAAAHGAQFRFHAEVTAIEQTGGRCTGVALAGGDVVRAPVVVNVGGPHSSFAQSNGRCRGRHAHPQPCAPPGDVHRRGSHRPAAHDGCPPSPTWTSASTSGPSSAARGWSAVPSRPATRSTGRRPRPFDEHPTVERFESR